MNAPLLRMTAISKSFFGVRVLHEVDLDLQGGEVLALMGENGAGKSTLIKILNGDYAMDAGSIELSGEPVHFSLPRDAEEAGIRMLYQELHYAPDLSVAENMAIGQLPRANGLLGGLVVDRRKMVRQAAEHLELLGVDVDPRARMRDLAVVERQIVEIVKAVSADARILVMDEPTAALTPKEVNLLFDLVRDLKRRGVGIIYVSHRLDEIFELADRVLVLRDGRKVAARPVAEVTPASLVDMMIGRELEERRRDDRRASRSGAAQPILEVRGLSRRGEFHDVDLTVWPGEIVGMFGLLGSGQVPLSRAIYGATKADAGTLLVDGVEAKIASPGDAKRAGLGFVPADRKGSSLILEMSVRENITLSNWSRLATLGFFRQRLESDRTRSWIDRLGIRMAGGPETKVRLLSGGNQQKVVLARWLEADVRMLILNEPTWGVDVGARSDIYDQLEALAARGLGVLIVSSDIQEVLAVSHRVLTIYRGRLTGEFRGDSAPREAVLAAAAGSTAGGDAVGAAGPDTGNAAGAA
jgi:ribose transport system ATP-binding protein